jgi:hypothetical protein
VVEVIGQDKRFEKKDVRAGNRLPHSHDDHATIITCPQCQHTVDVTSTYGASSAETYAKQRRDDDY